MRIIKEILGFIIGLLEFVGLRYPVKHYIEKVSDELWRGSRLNPEDYQILRNNGIKLIVNLCAEKDLDTKLAAIVGIRSIRIKVIDNTCPTLEQIQIFLLLFNDMRNTPMFVHCEAGKGRTGIFVACYRMSKQRLVLEDALNDAKKHGLTLYNQELFLKEFARIIRRHI